MPLSAELGASDILLAEFIVEDMLAYFVGVRYRTIYNKGFVFK